MKLDLIKYIMKPQGSSHLWTQWGSYANTFFFSDLNLKIQSETLGKHESLGDTNSNSSHSFWDLEVMKYLDLLNCNMIKDPGMEWL